MFHFDIDFEPSMKKLKEELEKLQKRIQKAYQDQSGTNALNTDIVLQLSADGGSNYSTATLTALPDFSTGIKMAKVNDLAVTAGTQLKYKISFANQSLGSKEARIRGVALQY